MPDIAMVSARLTYIPTDKLIADYSLTKASTVGLKPNTVNLVNGLV